jgi:hypothetical protein
VWRGLVDGSGGQDCPAIDRICRAGGEGAKSECRASLREGLEETLTLLRLGVPPTLARSLRSTTCVENMMGICRDHSRNVKLWCNGQMALRWCAAGMVEATAQFRRVNGHLHPAHATGGSRTACRRRKCQPGRQQ